MNKYNAIKTEVDGIVFDSKGEGKRYWELKMLLRTGEITKLELQPKFVLQEKFQDNELRNHRAITYTADFMYLEKGRKIVEDFKSKATRTPAYMMKKKMLIYKYQDIFFREVSR